ncbi:peroxidase 5 [Zea mays]|uniref:Peroxidase n=1 Tax=Zea mays TaxID=4577 RepID=K7VDC0_MAIZE|nr:peroxidase 5 [Zea mays]AQL06237.1 Peroxidase K [Zea mays]|eukprot:XP_008660104.1 peroxidase 5 [Zea mays]
MAVGKGGGLLVLVVVGLLLHGTRVADAQSLRVGYYSQTCGSAESIVADEVQKASYRDRGVLASLIRLHFHDCFVNGCDGSVLLEASDRQAEKNAKPNLSLRGFDVIERIKQRLEAACALTVSCADIVAFAARDSVKLSGGLWYAVPGGRQDGTVSRASMTGDLPPPNQRNVDLLAQYFYRKGLTLDEMVLLSAAHTVGIAHCSSFDYRLTSDQDKGMDPAFRNSLRSQCQYNPSNYVPLDAGSQYAFDTGYFSNVLANRTVLDSDAALASPRTADKVKQWKNNPDWFKNSFAAAMVKMGSIRGSYPGKVRLNCTRVRM